MTVYVSGRKMTICYADVVESVELATLKTCISTRNVVSSGQGGRVFRVLSFHSYEYAAILFSSCVFIAVIRAAVYINTLAVTFTLLLHYTLFLSLPNAT